MIDFQLFSQDIMQFKYNEIPFGKSEEEVLNLVKVASIEQDEYVSVVDFYGCSAIKKHFDNCVYTFMGMGGCFVYDFTKKFTIKYDNWDNIESIDLYFVKKYDTTEPYTLFLVHKKMKSEDDKLQNVTNKYKLAVSKILNKQPITTNSNYILPSGDYTANSNLLFWDTNLYKVFVLAVDYAFMRSPEFIYVSKSGLNKYRQSVILYENAKKQKQQNKSVQDF